MIEVTLSQKIDARIFRLVGCKSDTYEILEQKAYFLRNFIIPVILISLALTTTLILNLFPLFLIVSPLLISLLTSLILFIIIKKGIQWFLHLTYGGYIIICFLIVLRLGGLPNSLGVWGGAFIVFMHALGIKNKKLLIVNALIYSLCLVIIGFSYPHLTPYKYLDSETNNLFFTFNEIWMCLFLVRAFYDSIVARTNEAKQKAEHLQKLDMLKSKLYANITHEFRTPLTLIRGNAEEITEYLDGETTEKAKNIIQSSDKILFLVNQMLNLSKIEEGRVPMHYIQCDLVNFVRFVVGSVQGFADLRKIRLHYKPGLSQLLMDIEPEKLEESLANLLSNAIKYTLRWRCFCFAPVVKSG
jgi:signal transduction histidine kinase